MPRFPKENEKGVSRKVLREWAPRSRQRLFLKGILWEQLRILGHLGSALCQVPGDQQRADGFVAGSSRVTGQHPVRKARMEEGEIKSVQWAELHAVFSGFAFLSARE